METIHTDRTTRRQSLRFGAAAALPLLGALSGCAGAPTGEQPAAKIAAPVTLLMLTDHSGADLEAQKALFGRFTQEQPNVSFELSPNGPGQAARDRVKVMAQGGTPPDFWESTRAAFGDMLLLGVIASIS